MFILTKVYLSFVHGIPKSNCYGWIQNRISLLINPSTFFAHKLLIKIHLTSLQDSRWKMVSKPLHDMKWWIEEIVLDPKALFDLSYEALVLSCHLFEVSWPFVKLHVDDEVRVTHKNKHSKKRQICTDFCVTLFLASLILTVCWLFF